MKLLGFSKYLLSAITLFLLLPNFVQSADDDNATNDPIPVLLFMFFGLGMGVLTMQILSKIGDPLPYTVVVFLLGAIFSLVTIRRDPDDFSKSISDWILIDADLMLFVFLPPLIFGEAMSLNWHHVKGGLLQATILAGPGILVGAALMGVFVKVLLPYNWSWNLAMVFGSILSATDPVAVVALLKSAGASPTLTILIVGESLLNDGTAMVLFELFFNLLNGETYTAGEIIAFGIEASLGSVLLGIGFGLCTVRWLRTANRPLNETDVTVQIAITICCAYLTFFTAQYVFAISGVLACCGAGVMLAWLGPPIILSHETMHNVWGMIEWSMNTMIFLLAGLIIGHRTLGQVNRIDWLYLIVLYLFLMVIRFVLIAALYPFLANLGHGCSPKEGLFMAWAGLRGALGMALALIVEKNAPSDISAEASRLFFFVGGIAAMTLIFNATTANALLRHLGLLGNDSVEKGLVMGQIKKKLRKKMGAVIDQMASELPESDVMEIRNSCTLLREVNVETLFRDTDLYRDSDLLAITKEGQHQAPFHFNVERESAEDARLHSTTSRHGSSISEPRSSGHRKQSNSIRFRLSDDQNGSEPNGASRMPSGISFNTKLDTELKVKQFSRLLSMSTRGENPEFSLQLLAFVRAIFLEIVRVRYWHDIEAGKLPRLSHSAQFLLYSIDVGLDLIEAQSGAQDWLCVESHILDHSLLIATLTYCEDHFPVLCKFTSSTLGFLEARREKRNVYMLTSFIEAHEHAQKKIHSFLSVDDDHDPAHGALGNLQTPEELKVIAESQKAVANAKKLLEGMNPETVSAIRAKQGARIVLAKEAEMVKQMVQEGLLTPKHAEEFLEEIGADAAAIERSRNHMYRKHAKMNTERRKAQKVDDRLRTSDLSIPIISGNTSGNISGNSSVTNPLATK